MSDGYQVGDDIPLTLRVVPDNGVPTDGTTAVTVTARCEDGTVVSPPLTPNADRSVWRAVLASAQAGEWLITWSVTGTGAGVVTDPFTVATLPVVPVTGRTYATVAQLTAYGVDAPPGAGRLLRRATRKIDELTRTAVWPVDDLGMPTDPAVATALREAVCEQVEWWGETGDDTGGGAVAALAGAKIGTVQLPTAGGGQTLEYAPGAMTVLRAAGLLNQGPRIPGGTRFGALR